MKIRMGTIAIPEELRTALGRTFFEPYEKKDILGNVETVAEYDGTLATHTEIQQFLKEKLWEIVDNEIEKEIKINQEVYEKRQARASRRAILAKERADQLGQRLSKISKSQPAKVQAAKNHQIL